ncbi:MAG TPA: hypothetical protein VL651_05095 [Bacteroidia bacterium]|jgi:hypothetical protein|nr:hypothetical protein [Bacteroidia bacterium]
MKKYISIVVAAFLFCRISAQVGDTLVFERISDPHHHYSVLLPTYCKVVMNDGKKIGGCLWSVSDSTITLRIAGKTPPDNAQLRKNLKDKSLSKKARLIKNWELICPDSMILNYRSIRKIVFNNFQAPYYGRKILEFVGTGVLYIVTSAAISKYFIPAPANDQDLGASTYVYLGELEVWIAADYFFLLSKRIKPTKWSYQP